MSMKELLEDMRDNGLRFDLNPTYNLNEPHEFFHAYIKHIDASIRERAAGALQEQGNKLALLLRRCKCGVHLTVNAHRDVYINAQQQIAEWNEQLDCPLEIDPDVLKVICDTDTIVELQFYPDTPIGFYRIIHHDLETALDMALAVL